MSNKDEVKIYLDKVNTFRNKVCKLNKEADALTQEGKDIKGNFQSVDFDGDQTETWDNLGAAFGYGCELEQVAYALYHWFNGGYEVCDE